MSATSRDEKSPGGSALSAAVARLVFANPLYPRTLDAPALQSLIFQPRCLIAGDAAEANRLFQGRWCFGGYEVREPARAPWDAESRGPTWEQALHGFFWLEHFRAAGGEAARQHAAALLNAWIQKFGRFDTALWEPKLLSRRLLAWIIAADFLLDGADKAFSAKFLDTLHRQARHLIRAAHYLPSTDAEFDIGAALMVISVTLPGRQGEFDHGLSLLARGLAKELAADGNHISRNPTCLFDRLRDCLTLGEILDQANILRPDDLRFAIARMTPALRFLRLSDGTLAQFNGGVEGQPDAIDLLLGRTGQRDRPPTSLFATGFERLTAARTCLVMDTGMPLAGLSCHAAPLSFELSIARHRLFVNCGGALRRDGDWVQALASTAAHTTLTIAETNAIPLNEHARPLRQVPGIRVERQDNDDGQRLEASHDGYLERFGLVHNRMLFLARNGEELQGRDTLTGPAIGLSFALRFHLHPDAQVTLVQADGSALIRLKSGAGFRFSVQGSRLSLEESIYTGRGSIEKTQQLVIGGRTAGSETTLAWVCERIVN